MQITQKKQEIGRYIVQAQVGKGTFGTIFKAVSKQDCNQAKQPLFYAIKIEPITALKPMLHLEYQILSILKQKQKQTASIKKGFEIPEVLEYKELDYYAYMVMEFLDTTLQDFANKQKKNVFSKDCLIRLFYSILKIIQMLHKLGYVHRDIKPANFMLKAANQIVQSQKVDLKYLPAIFPIDLGLCKKFINPMNSKHISFKDNRKMIGTALFCSLNTHKGFEQSRRDDIQAIVYMVTYLVKKLPWEIATSKIEDKQRLSPRKKEVQISSPTKKNLKQKSKLDVYEQIHQIKNSTKFDEFLNDSGLLPNCFLSIYKYCIKLQFEQQPNYPYIYGLLQKQHHQLTNQPLQANNFLLRWSDSSIKSEKIKLKQCQSSKDKKIKINFKIPESKLKKTASIATSNQTALQTIVPNLQKIEEKTIN